MSHGVRVGRSRTAGTTACLFYGDRSKRNAESCSSHPHPSVGGDSGEINDFQFPQLRDYKHVCLREIGQVDCGNEVMEEKNVCDTQKRVPNKSLNKANM